MLPLNSARMQKYMMRVAQYDAVNPSMAVRKRGHSCSHSTSLRSCTGNVQRWSARTSLSRAPCKGEAGSASAIATSFLRASVAAA